MDLERYYELRTILQQWKRRLADSIRGRIVEGAHHLERLRQIYAGEGTDEAFTEWLDRWCRQAAIQFILRVLFLRVLEDRDLLGATRIRDTDGQRMWGQLTRNLGAASYVQWCCWDAAHLLPDLFGPTEYDLAQRFLDDVWRRPDPDREGWLRFDFRPSSPSPLGGEGRGEGEGGDPGFQTRFIGDLYQELDAEIRERYALLQTPHFISQFILEHTLLKRFEELDFREVTLIDPTCGSGHFLVDAFWMFVERYERARRGEMASRPTAGERAEIARTIIQNHLFGCDINPYATALARFRLTLAACDYARPTSLRDFRDLRFNLATIDSLIPYEKLMVGGVQAGSAATKVLGQPEAIRHALPVLRKRHDVVVGNPPYISSPDKNKRELYKGYYATAIERYGLAVPFMERFVQLASERSLVGAIVSNAFTAQSFGRILIEGFFPKYDLSAVVDLDGCYIPGHGTPTLILFVRKDRPTTNSIKLVYTLKGEGEAPRDPRYGRVWTSVKSLFPQTDGGNEYAAVATVAREYFSTHPWNLKLPKAKIKEAIDHAASTTFDEWLESIGLGSVTGVDDLFVVPQDLARRKYLRPQWLAPIVAGEDIRDWLAYSNQLVIFPYCGEDLSPANWGQDCPEFKWFAPYRTMLGNRVTSGAGKTFNEVGRHFYEYHQFPSERFSREVRIVVPRMATHGHFTFSKKSTVYKDSVITFDFREGIHPDSYPLLAALLNSSIVCFHLKQICYNRGSGRDRVRDRYANNGQKIGTIPVPFGINHSHSVKGKRLGSLAHRMIGLAKNLHALTMHKVFEQKGEAYHGWNSALDGYVAPHPALYPEPVEGFTSTRELRAAREALVALRQGIRARMIFLQEEMDWLAYEMYGLLKAKAPLAEDYLSRADYEAARLELGQRPFEVAGKGYTGDWPKGYKPAPLPESLRPLTEARVAVMEANPDIALLEDPLYKRRWIPPDYEAEFRQAAEWWLAEKLEYALEGHGRPISLRGWTRTLGRDERVNAVLEALTGTPHFDLEGELLKVIRANAVPNRPEGYLKPAGLLKFYTARRSDPPGTPEYKSAECSDSTAWKLRGKLNIPRERFIAYAEFDHTQRGVDAPETGGPWFGWAGWDAAQRADALAFLLDQANRAGWEQHWRQCGLRAALRDLLPELKDLPAAHRAEFEAIAGMCGIGLGTACYCQAYRDGVARGEPGVPGVNAKVLGVKVVAAEGRGSKRGRRRKANDSNAEQLGLNL